MSWNVSSPLGVQRRQHKNVMFICRLLFWHPYFLKVWKFWIIVLEKEIRMISTYAELHSDFFLSPHCMQASFSTILNFTKTNILKTKMILTYAELHSDFFPRLVFHCSKYPKFLKQRWFWKIKTYAELHADFFLKIVSTILNFTKTRFVLSLF